MPTLLARNADVLVTMDGERRELKNAGLYAEDGIIRQVGPTAELPATADTVIDLAGQIVLPGFVNTHHHLNQTLTRNFPGAQNNNLFPWLQALYRVWARTDAEASRASTLIGLAELALSGCTTVFDHSYVFKNGNNVDCQIEAARDLGVRFHASRGSMSLGESKGGLPPDDCVEDEAFILKDSQRVIEQLSRRLARLDDADRAGTLLALLGHHHAAEGVGGARPPLQGQAAHPSLRDARRGALHARALPAASGRLDGDAGLAGRRRLVRARDPCRRRRDPQIRRDRLRRGALPLLQHAARLGHRAGQEVHGGRREGRAWASTARPATTPRTSCSKRARRCCWRGCGSACCRPRGRASTCSCRSPIRCAPTNG